MTKKEEERKEAISIIRTMQFAINALEMLIEGKDGLYRATNNDAYAHQGDGLQEGVDFLIRLKKVKDDQFEAKNK